ncbi:hypothetical protein AAG570_003263 [Ranatra chinensis]|uniref:non-specific serine/threonine protein kinase n=1 Tax=Ranatra chinensis TaxID=642074 RepID=A0ABD0YP59_9HEMI
MLYRGFLTFVWTDESKATASGSCTVDDSTWTPPKPRKNGESSPGSTRVTRAANRRSKKRVVDSSTPISRARERGGGRVSAGNGLLLSPVSSIDGSPGGLRTPEWSPNGSSQGEPGGSLGREDEPEVTSADNSSSRGGHEAEEPRGGDSPGVSPVRKTFTNTSNLQSETNSAKDSVAEGSKIGPSIRGSNGDIPGDLGFSERDNSSSPDNRMPREAVDDPQEGTRSHPLLEGVCVPENCPPRCPHGGDASLVGGGRTSGAESSCDTAHGSHLHEDRVSEKNCGPSWSPEDDGGEKSPGRGTRRGSRSSCSAHRNTDVSPNRVEHDSDICLLLGYPDGDRSYRQDASSAENILSARVEEGDDLPGYENSPPALKAKCSCDIMSDRASREAEEEDDCPRSPSEEGSFRSPQCDAEENHFVPVVVAPMDISRALEVTRSSNSAGENSGVVGEGSETSRTDGSDIFEDSPTERRQDRQFETQDDDYWISAPQDYSGSTDVACQQVHDVSPLYATGGYSPVGGCGVLTENEEELLCLTLKNTLTIRGGGTGEEMAQYRGVKYDAERNDGRSRMSEDEGAGGATDIQEHPDASPSPRQSRTNRITHSPDASRDLEKSNRSEDPSDQLREERSSVEGGGFCQESLEETQRPPEKGRAGDILVRAIDEAFITCSRGTGRKHAKGTERETVDLSTQFLEESRYETSGCDRASSRARDSRSSGMSYQNFRDLWNECGEEMRSFWNIGDWEDEGGSSGEGEDREGRQDYSLDVEEVMPLEMILTEDSGCEGKLSYESSPDTGGLGGSGGIRRGFSPSREYMSGENLTFGTDFSLKSSSEEGRNYMCGEDSYTSVRGTFGGGSDPKVSMYEPNGEEEAEQSGLDGEAGTSLPEQVCGAEVEEAVRGSEYAMRDCGGGDAGCQDMIPEWNGSETEWECLRCTDITYPVEGRSGYNGEEEVEEPRDDLKRSPGDIPEDRVCDEALLGGPDKPENEDLSLQSSVSPGNRPQVHGEEVGSGEGIDARPRQTQESDLETRSGTESDRGDSGAQDGTYEEDDVEEDERRDLLADLDLRIAVPPGKGYRRSLSVIARGFTRTVLSPSRGHQPPTITGSIGQHAQKISLFWWPARIIMMQVILFHDSENFYRLDITRYSVINARVGGDKSEGALFVAASDVADTSGIVSTGTGDGVSLDGRRDTLIAPTLGRFEFHNEYRRLVLSLCEQEEFCTFRQVVGKDSLAGCTKIGEGLYGEVFKLSRRGKADSVLKVVPIEGDFLVNGEPQKRFEQVYSELVITHTMNGLHPKVPFYAKLVKSWVVRDKYPEKLLCRWDHFKKTRGIAYLKRIPIHYRNYTTLMHATSSYRILPIDFFASRKQNELSPTVSGPIRFRLIAIFSGAVGGPDGVVVSVCDCHSKGPGFDSLRGSDNDSPRMFGKDQLYLVLEIVHAGVDMESYNFNTAAQTVSVLKQVSYGLAAGEEWFQFEHRDLHWGNVLVAKTNEHTVEFTLNGKTRKLRTGGVKATIIDFTLSSVTLEGGERVFNDISKDPDMFIATGDYQFDIYRLMRHEVGNNWEMYRPKTNVMWLHYLVDKMANSVEYAIKKPKRHYTSMRTLKVVKNWMMACKSASDAANRLLNYNNTWPIKGGQEKRLKVAEMRRTLGKGYKMRPQEIWLEEIRYQGRYRKEECSGLDA